MPKITEFLENHASAEAAIDAAPEEALRLICEYVGWDIAPLGDGQTEVAQPMYWDGWRDNTENLINSLSLAFAIQDAVIAKVGAEWWYSALYRATMASDDRKIFGATNEVAWTRLNAKMHIESESIYRKETALNLVGMINAPAAKRLAASLLAIAAKESESK